MLPTDVLDRPAWRFWMDANIRQAGVAWENEQRRQARRNTDAGAATGAEQQDLVDAQEARADRREQIDGQPSLREQMDALGDG